MLIVALPPLEVLTRTVWSDYVIQPDSEADGLGGKAVATGLCYTHLSVTVTECHDRSTVHPPNMFS
jgi:hypothetical protein